GSQTGNGGGVSNAGLILDLHRAERGEQLLDQVVLLVVEGGAAEAREAHRPPDPQPVLGLPLPAGAARLDHPVGDHVHRRVEVEALPLGAVRAAVEDPVLPCRPGGQLEGGRALRAQPPPADRRVRVALDLDDLAVLDVDVLPAADRAVRADRLHDLVGAGHPRLEPFAGGALGRRAATQRVAAGELAVDGPRPDPLANAHVTASFHLGAASTYPGPVHRNTGPPTWSSARPAGRLTRSRRPPGSSRPAPAARRSARRTRSARRCAGSRTRRRRRAAGRRTRGRPRPGG